MCLNFISYVNYETKEKLLSLDIKIVKSIYKA